VAWSAAALADVNRFASFLTENHPAMAATIAEAISAKVVLLGEFPQLGRPLARRRNYRQAVLRVSNAAYVVRYRLLRDEVLILRIFHGKEARPRI
jgi:plasmid stabilization system protein ParE